jgi:ketosteroid isomerase-like protein
MPNDQHIATINRFYEAFAALDDAAMGDCYDDNVEFDDEVFSLRGKTEVAGMWSMLCSATREKGKDVWRLTHTNVTADENSGGAHWDAHYLFSATGRTVDNHVDTVMEFGEDGLIVRQTDAFDFWAWSRQALGPAGWALGWSPILKGKVRSNAKSGLATFLKR